MQGNFGKSIYVKWFIEKFIYSRNEKWIQEARADTLRLYRTLFKVIPKCFERRLPVVVRRAELRFIFEENKKEIYIENIKDQKKVGRDGIASILPSLDEQRGIYQ